jgi:hypothetical protein
LMPTWLSPKKTSERNWNLNANESENDKGFKLNKGLREDFE